MNVPSEIELVIDDQPARVRFDYYRGERQWFNPLKGVGHPGCPPTVYIHDVDFGHGWKSVDAYPGIDWEAMETLVLERIEEAL